MSWVKALVLYVFVIVKLENHKICYANNTFLATFADNTEIIATNADLNRASNILNIHLN